MFTADEQALLDALGRLHDRINHIADLEARSAMVKGWIAEGHLVPLKQKLIGEVDEILDQLMGGGNAEGS
jgi:hypothetical protein